MKLASDLVGFLYPAYMSFKALEGGKTVDGDATQWMTYWVIFSFMMLLESTFPLARTVRFFHFIKIGVIIWLYHPQTSGAQVIYSSVVRPNVQKFAGAKKNRIDLLFFLVFSCLLMGLFSRIEEIIM